MTQDILFLNQVFSVNAELYAKINLANVKQLTLLL